VAAQPPFHNLGWNLAQAGDTYPGIRTIGGPLGDQSDGKLQFAGRAVQFNGQAGAAVVRCVRNSIVHQKLMPRDSKQLRPSLLDFRGKAPCQLSRARTRLIIRVVDPDKHNRHASSDQ
jgi:hypothetical protein